ncbi:MAG: hypothetical protein IK115_04440 [Lachnospiraceae bacterium]|nr:hypothetical protein [Lachnospiraceae bacterium]
MKENLSIVLLLCATTLLASLIIIAAYKHSWPYKEARMTVSREAVSSDTAESLAQAPLPSPTPGPASPTPKPTEGAEHHAPTGAVEITAVPTLPEDLPTPTPVPKSDIPPMGVIVDLDYNSDVDDVAALRIATSLAKLGRIELRAVMASTAGEEVCKAMHAHLRYDGFGSVPIGASVGTVHSGSPYWKDMINAHFSEADYKLSDSLSLYKAVLADCSRREELIRANMAAKKQAEKDKEKAMEETPPETDGEGNSSGNHKRTMEEREKAEEAEREAKEAAAQSAKIRIITTGYLVNIAALLQDPEGYALVAKYVDSIWITGGVYLQGEDHNFCVTEEAALAANYVSLNCPVPLIYSSSASVEEGEDVIVCGGSIMNAAGAGLDPVVIAFSGYGKANNVNLKGGRIAWDPFCVWAACLPSEDTLTHLQPIHISVSAGGWNRFREDLPANCQYIVRDSKDLGWYVGQLDMIINLGLAR